MQQLKNGIWFEDQRIILWFTNYYNLITSGFLYNIQIELSRLCLCKHLTEPYSFGVYKNQCSNLYDQIPYLDQIFTDYKIKESLKGTLVLNEQDYVYYRLMLPS